MQVDIKDVITAFSVVGNLVQGWLLYTAKRGESEQGLVKTALELIQPLKDQIAALQKQNAEAQARIEILENTVRQQQVTIDQQQKTIEQQTRVIAQQSERIEIFTHQLHLVGLKPAETQEFKT